MGFLIARATAGSQTPITSESVPDALKARQLLLRRRILRLGVDVDHVAGLGPLIAANWLGGLQIHEPAEAQDLEHPAHGGERCSEHPGNATESTALMPEVNSVLQLQWTERPPLSAANARSTKAATPPER